jgi:hypothetical protein
MTMMTPSILLLLICFRASPLSFIINLQHQPVTDHFESGPGRNLSNKPQTFFADEIIKSGYAAHHLAAKAFDNKAHLLTDEELSSPSETYVHLLIASFMITLSLS